LLISEGQMPLLLPKTQWKSTESHSSGFGFLGMGGLTAGYCHGQGQDYARSE